MGANDIFIWEPDFNQIGTGLGYRTLVTPFESGVEQRRYKSANPKYSSNLTFQRYLTNRGELKSIWEFFKAREGKLDWFWLPSFKRDTKLTANASAGDSTITVENADRFTDEADTHGNYVYLNNGTNYEVRQVDSIAGNILTLVSVLAYSYTIAAAPGKAIWAQVSYKMRFDNDEYSEDNFADFAFNSGITFIEVFFPDN